MFPSNSVIHSSYPEPDDPEVFRSLYEPDPFEALAPPAFRIRPMATQPVFQRQLPRRVWNQPLPTFVPMAGDWVRTPIPGLPVGHDGIIREVFSFESGYFTGTIAHSMKGVGAVETDASAFGQRIFLVRRAVSPLHVHAIMQRVEQSLGQPYYLIERNCQHFASFAFTGKAESESVNAVAGLATVAAVVALFANRGRR